MLGKIKKIHFIGIGGNPKSIAIDRLDAGIKIFSFIDEMDLAYSASDFVISRAGATAISEILYLEKKRSTLKEKS